MRILVSGLLAALLIAPRLARADDTPPPGTPVTAVSPSSASAPNSGTATLGTSPASGQPNQPTATEAAPLLPIPFQYTFHGFVRGGYTYVPYNGDVSQLIGHDSGFRLYNARLEFSGAFGKWVDFVLSVDTTMTIDSTTGIAPSMFNFADAYTTLHWGPAYLRVGQFKTPFNGEFLLDDEFIPFVRRSAVSEGLAADEAQTPQPGILLDRQLGAMVGGRLGLGGKLGLNGAFAAVNGNGPNQARNDNTKVALVARLALGNDRFSVGVSGYWNDRTTGILATRTDVRDLAADFDFLLDFKFGMTGLKIFGMTAYRYTTNLTVPGNAPVNSFGGVASASVPVELKWVVVEPAFRYVYFQPDSTLRAPTDSSSATSAAFALNDATLGINISPRVVPLRFQVNYTYRAAAAIWAQPSSLFETVLQANF